MAILRAKEASSSSASGPRYQVFLSFRGKDTQKTYTDHLYTALVQAEIHTFKDENELQRGKNIAYELHKAIGESKIAVIVFSKGYASSEWCLDELVGILERKKKMGLIVIPMFYDMQPSDVWYQRGIFGEAFSVHEDFEFESEKLMKKMDKWRAALSEVAHLGGMVLQNEANGVIDDTFRLSKCVHIARLYLEDDDAVNAEAFINKASFLVSNSQHEVLNLQYKVCYARI